MNSLNTRLAPGPMSDRTGAIAADLIRRYGMPDRLLDKSAAEIFEGTPIRTGYADTAKTYPVHSPSSAWLSAAAYHDTASSDPVVGNRIKEACEWFGVGSEWDRLEAIRPKEASAPPVKTWALPHCQKYPLDTEGQVKAAADYFDRWSDRLSVDDRRVYAEQLVKAAESFPRLFDGDRLWRFEAEAGLGLPADGWRVEFSQRAKKAREVGETELAEAIEKAASDAEAQLFEGGTFRNAGELAEMWKKLDERFKWGRDEPIKGLVGMTPSQAREKLASAVQAGSGAWYLKSDLDRVSDEACWDLCGTGPIVSREAKIAALANPKSPFEKLAKSMGVVPVQRANRPRVDWKAEAKEAMGDLPGFNDKTEWIPSQSGQANLTARGLGEVYESEVPHRAIPVKPLVGEVDPAALKNNEPGLLDGSASHFKDQPWVEDNWPLLALGGAGLAGGGLAAYLLARRNRKDKKEAAEDESFFAAAR